MPSAPQPIPERIDQRIADPVDSHRVNERPHVLGTGAHDPVRGPQPRLGRLQVRLSAVAVDAPRQPHPGRDRSVRGFRGERLPPALLGCFSILEGAQHGPPVRVGDVEDEPPTLTARRQAEDGAGRAGAAPAALGPVQERAVIAG